MGFERTLSDADVLGHLERDNLGVALGHGRNEAVVGAENAAALLGNAVVAHELGAELGLVHSESDWRESEERGKNGYVDGVSGLRETWGARPRMGTNLRSRRSRSSTEGTVSASRCQQ